MGNRRLGYPQDLTGLRAFLGLVGCYRQYIPDFVGIAQPLNRLTAKGVPWQWSPVEQGVFDRLKDCLLSAPILVYPDPALEYILDTDTRMWRCAVTSTGRPGSSRSLLQ